MPLLNPRNPMEYPDSILRAVEDAVKQHPDDVPQAINCAERSVRKTPDYPTVVDELIRDAVSQLVYRARHAINVRLKNAAGAYNQKTKVNGASAAVQKVCEDFYAYTIGQKTLGNLLGSELDGIARSESAIASGHRFNARLC